MPSLGSWHTSKSSSSQKCQKWSSDLIVVPVESSTCQVIFGYLSNGTIANEGQESLPVFTLEYNLAVVSFFDVNFEGLQVVNFSCIEHSPVLTAGGN